MNRIQYALMVTIFASMGKGKSHYTQSSITAILANLSEYHDINIKRSWLFKNIRRLLDAGYINRRSRYRHDGSGFISQIPSLIIFTYKGSKWLARLGIRGARTLRETIRTFLEKRDGRWPHKRDFEPDGGPKPDPETKRRLSDLLDGVGERI